jgi:hypothetical protein
VKVLKGCWAEEFSRQNHFSHQKLGASQTSPITFRMAQSNSRTLNSLTRNFVSKIFRMTKENSTGDFTSVRLPNRSSCLCGSTVSSLNALSNQITKLPLSVIPISVLFVFAVIFVLTSNTKVRKSTNGKIIIALLTSLLLTFIAFGFAFYHWVDERYVVLGAALVEVFGLYLTAFWSIVLSFDIWVVFR